MAAVLKAFAAAFLVVVALSWLGVSAPTHHVVGGDQGWGPDLDISSWLSGRVFSVGDKIWFKYSGTEDSVIELQGLEEFLSCNLTNPIRMYSDPVNHVVLDKGGVRYFTSGNPERCKNGLKLPVSIRPAAELSPPFPHYPPPFDPYEPDTPTPPFPHSPPFPHYPPPSDPSPPFPYPPPFDPYTPVKPTPPFAPPEPVQRPPPPPRFVPPPPSTAPRLNGRSFVLYIVALLFCYIGI